MKIHQSHCIKALLRKIIFSGIIIFPLLVSFSCYSQVSIITERLRTNLISATVIDDEITNYLKTLKTDGSWGDIDYTASTNWQAVRHLRRLQSICIAYNKPTSIHYHLKDVKAGIQTSIDFYIKAKPRSSGWWQNAIGAPTVIGPLLILMKTGDNFGFEQQTLDYYADELLNYYTESAIKWQAETTGANKTWMLSSSIYKACIKEDEAVLSSNFQSVFEEASINEGKAEGIKADYSFFQHGPQLYNGGYGRDFMLDISYFGTLAQGTTYQMSDSRLQVITNCLLDGYQWFCQKSAFDFHCLGRELVRPGSLSNVPLKTVITRLKAMNARRSTELTNFYDFIDGKSDFQSPGNKHFWKADIMVQHGASFYLSTKIPSSRTTGTEKVSGENLKRWFLPWGSTNIMVDGDEYQNIFAVWDWSRVPGVTSLKDGVTREDPFANQSTINLIRSTYLISSAEFAGGVSDGVLGLAAYDYSWDGIRGRKAYFFTPEAMFCIGTGINASKTNSVITNVNQCNSSGPVTISRNGVKSTFDGTQLSNSDLKWTHHDNVGYLFPKGGDLTLMNMNQTGSLKDITTSQSAPLQTRKVFSLFFDHGNTPTEGSYEYVVVPSKDLTQFEKWAGNNPLSSLINTRDYQAVKDNNSGAFGIAFYRSGTVSLETGLSVLVSRPCLVLIQSIKKGTGYKITISDPTASIQNIILKISKKLKGPGAIVNSDQSSSITISFPAGDYAGKSLIMEFANEPASNSSGIENFKPGPLPNFY